MSSALERLKALAAAKKQQQKLVELVTPNTEANLEARLKLAAEAVAKEREDASKTQAQETSIDSPSQPVSTAVDSGGRAEDIQDVPSAEVAPQQSEETEVQSVPSSAGDEVLPATEAGTEHPLIMELAELEEALTKNIPDFRVILRNIHQKLRADPELVTVLSEEEIGLIVSGLATHANAEIIAPKAVKAARATAKKTPISADDL